MDEEETHLNKTEARAGGTTGMVRVVLVASLLLVIVGLVAILLIWRH